MSVGEKFRSCSCACSKSCWRRWIKNNLLLVYTLVAVILGIIAGLGLRQVDLSYEASAWIAIWGQLFMRMLKCIMVPLLFACLTVGISSMQGAGGGRVGVMTLTYIFATQILSAVFALAMGVAINPGANLERQEFNRTYTAPSYTDLLGDFLRNMFPDNMFRACLENGYTRMSKRILTTSVNDSLNLTIHQVEREYLYKPGPNIMGVILFSIAIGVGINTAGSAGTPLHNLLVSLQKVIFKIMMGIIWISPLGIFSLMTSSLIKVDNLGDVITSLGKFIGSVLIVQLMYMFVLLPLVLTPMLRDNVYRVIYKYLDAILAGFALCSSVAAMPLLLQDSEEKLGIDARISGFVAPVSVTINRDGSGMFVTMAVLFVAQTYGISLTPVEYIMLVVMTVIIISAAGAVPSGAIVVIVTICESLGIPSGERVGLLLTAEWLLDRVRTAANCESHALSIVVVDKFCRDHLATRVVDIESVDREQISGKVVSELQQRVADTM